MTTFNKTIENKDWKIKPSWSQKEFLNKTASETLDEILTNQVINEINEDGENVDQGFCEV